MGDTDSKKDGSSKRPVLHYSMTLEKLVNDAKSIGNQRYQARDDSQEGEQARGHEAVGTRPARAASRASSNTANNVHSSKMGMLDRPGSAVTVEAGTQGGGGIVRAESTYVSVSSIMKPQVSAFKSIDMNHQSKSQLRQDQSQEIAPVRDDSADEVKIDDDDNRLATFEESPPREELMNTQAAVDQSFTAISAGPGMPLGTFGAGSRHNILLQTVQHDSEDPTAASGIF